MKLNIVNQDTVEKVTSFKKCPRYDRHGKEIPPSSGSLEELIESGETYFLQLAGMKFMIK